MSERFILPPLDVPPFSYQGFRALAETQQGGGDMFEVFRTLQRMKPVSPANWHREWYNQAAAVEAMAVAAEERGRRQTAGKHYLRAANYYRSAEFFLDGRDPQKLDTYSKLVSCFQRGIALINVRSTRFVQIPFENSILTGYFLPAVTDRPKSPGVVYLGGADSIAEELCFLGGWEIAERGMHCLIVDCPGQGASLRMRGLYSRYDYETPVKSLVDYLAGRPEVDSEAIGIIGASMGGYYAPRAAAFEPRLKACVVWGACHDVLTDLYDFYPPIQKPIQLLLGVENDNEARLSLKDFTLTGVVERVACPLLVAHGSKDIIVSLEAATKTYNQATVKDKELKIWDEKSGGSAHCMMDGHAVALPYMFDWLAEKLSVY